MEPTKYNVTGELSITRQNARYTVSYTIAVDQDVLADDEDAAANAVLGHYLDRGGVQCEWVGRPEVRERE